MFVSNSSFAADTGQGGQSSSGVMQTQQQRSSERFDIISWIRGNQARIAAQDAKYGRGKGFGGATPDLTLTYMRDSGSVYRDGNILGTDTRSTGRVQFFLNDLFTAGNKTRSLNIDVGVEGFLGQTTFFTADPTVTQTTHSYSDFGGALLLRPFGRSSQDTSLFVKGGYLNFAETGLWSNSNVQVSLYGTYLGAEAKLYLLPFLGARAEYQAVLETQSNTLQGKWKMQRFYYGGFLEIYLLNLGIYLVSTEVILTPAATGNPTKETYSGVGFSGTLYF